MQDYFKSLAQVKRQDQIAAEAYREAQIEYVRREGLYEELERLRNERGNSDTLNLVELILDTLTRRHT